MARGDKSYTRPDGTKVIKGKDGKLKGSVAAPKKTRKNEGTNYPSYAQAPTLSVAQSMRQPTVRKTFTQFLNIVKSGRFPKLNAYLRNNKLFRKASHS